MEFALTVALISVVTLTIIYQILPYRIATNKQPSIALFPKYKKRITTSQIDPDMEGTLARYGFKKSVTKGHTTYFARGHWLGDFSIKAAKIKLSVTPLGAREYEITANAGWVAAFDTGDLWAFITELCETLENT